MADFHAVENEERCDEGGGGGRGGGEREGGGNGRRSKASLERFPNSTSLVVCLWLTYK